jgi:hypothetical protein
MKGAFSTPILHMSMYALYSNIVPDMTYLPQTSMAICCGSGLNFPDTNRFFRRAMDAAKQRLIGNFVGAARYILGLRPDQMLTASKANILVYATVGLFACHAYL